MKMLQTKAFINGEFVDSLAGATFEVKNPHDDSLVAEVADCVATDLDTAVAAAAEAFPSWKKVLPRERAAILRRFGDLILEHQADLAELLTRENGKVLAEAKGEVGFAASFFHWYSEECRRNYGEHIPSPVGGKHFITMREPIGVAALICPWNFPIAMPARKVAASLGAGCTAVVKPAEDTPLVSLALAHLGHEAGVPAGVLNVVPCSRATVPEVGKAIADNPQVGVISFTGSCEVGRALYARCAAGVKRVGLELGGNAPFLVMDSAEVGPAVAGLMGAKFRNSGQTCVSANRILVQAGIYESFMEKFKEEVAKLVVGDGMQNGVNQGPLINEKQQAKVSRLVDESVAAGAEVVCGGAKVGRGYAPTILINVTPTMACWREEVFGPVAAIAKFESEEEALHLANDTDRGLAAFVYSQDHRQLWRVASGLEAGMVGVNDIGISSCETPFGGYKTSGIGKEGAKEGMEEYTNLKLIDMGGL